MMRKYTVIACLLFAVSAAAQQKTQPTSAGGFKYALVQAHFGEVPAFFRGTIGVEQTQNRNESGALVRALDYVYQLKAGGFFDLESPDGAQVEFRQDGGNFTAAASYINCDLNRKCESEWFGFWNVGPAVRMVPVTSETKIYGGFTAGFTAASDYTALQIAATWTKKWDLDATVTQQVQKFVLVDLRYRNHAVGGGVSLAVKNLRMRLGADLAGTKSLTLNAAF